MSRLTPASTRTDTLLPYTTLFRSRANLDEHLAEVRRRGGVDDRAMILHPHRLGEREAGERIDETGGAVGGIGAVGQRHHHLHGQAAIFGIHLAAEQREGERKSTRLKSSH